MILPAAAKRDVLVFSGLFVWAAALSAAAFVYAPYSAPIERYLQCAYRLNDGLPLTSKPPILYCVFLSFWLKAAGMSGVFVGQCLLYLATVCASYSYLRLLKVRVSWSAAAAFLISLHPYLLFNVKRIVDNNLAVPALVVFAVTIVCLRMGRTGFWTAALIGLFYGLMDHVRPNFLFLWGIVFFSLWKACFCSERRNWPVFFACVGFGVLAHVLTAYWITGGVYLLPSFGSYNFFVGYNPFTADALWTHLNPEPSFGAAVAHYGIDPRSPDADALFRQHAQDFVLREPFEVLKLAFLRFVTLFRPDLRLINASTTGYGPLILTAAQTVMALPLILWLAVRVKAGFRRLFEPPYVPMIILIYLLPCFLQNADPRYRLPTDILMILDTVHCLSLLKSQRT